MDDQTIAERILAGDERAFSALLSKYERMAYTIAFRIMGNREEAEEVTQDAFVRMYRALPDFRFDCKFSTWLCRIVYRVALTTLRQRQLFDDLDENTPLSTELADEEVASAESLLERADRREVVDQALERLPAGDRLLLTLYYLEERPVEEIRQITELTDSNIKVRLFRARKRLYALLREKMHVKKGDLL